MRSVYGIPVLLALGVASASAQSGSAPAAVVNDIGMQFVLIQPGSTRIGVFHPVCPVAGPTGAPTFPGAAAPGGGAARAGVPGAGGGGAPGGGGGGGGAPGGGGGAPGAGAPQNAAPRPPPDPRTLWTPEDAAKCAELAKRDEQPGFVVNIPRAFYMGKYEVTQGEWKAVMGTNPSVFQGSRVTDDADRHPVDNVTWEDAQAFVRKLNQMDRSARYRLPTEFEWEYAVRAGGPQDMAWATAREQAVSSGKTTSMVGTKKPNAWGLYDAVGNVWEWVNDYYNAKLFPDPTPPRSGSAHVLKGASFIGDVKNYTAATHAAGPGNGFDTGFRIVREAR